LRSEVGFTTGGQPPFLGLLHTVAVLDVQRAIVLYRIPRVVVGENRAFLGAEEYMCSNGIRVDVVQDAECIELMAEFIQANPRLWNEDIGV
jgi:hypothetical protein